MQMPKPMLSICIPAYDMHLKGAEYLHQSLARLVGQDFKGFEVIISDQSDTDAVANICVQYASQLNIRRVDFRSGKRQASANTNNAMRAADGSILKVLFQDDFLVRDDALSLIVKQFDAGADWVLCGSAKTRDGFTAERPMVPKMNPNLHFGRNTVSSPSVLAFRAGSDLFFDESLIWLMDVDFYTTCAKRFGPPGICSEVLVMNRLHEGQVSATVTPELRRQELAYIRMKYKSSETLANTLYYYRQVLKAR
jgi:glycosyltransferase involved in cell wall biosynthesis